MIQNIRCEQHHNRYEQLRRFSCARNRESIVSIRPIDRPTDVSVSMVALTVNIRSAAQLIILATTDGGELKECEDFRPIVTFFCVASCFHRDGNYKYAAV